MTREACRLMVIGGLMGMELSLVAARWASSLLFGLKAHDPLTLGAACVLLSAMTVLASFLPALRASRLDPMEALREE